MNGMYSTTVYPGMKLKVNKTFVNKNQDEVIVSNKIKGKVKNEEQDFNLILPRLRNLVNMDFFQFREEEKKTTEKSKLMFKLNQEQVFLETLTEEIDMIFFDPLAHQVKGKIILTSQRMMLQADVSDSNVKRWGLQKYQYDIPYKSIFESHVIKEKDIEIMEQEALLKERNKQLTKSAPVSKFNIFQLKFSKEEEIIKPLNIIEHNKDRRVKYFSIGYYSNENGDNKEMLRKKGFLYMAVRVDKIGSIEDRFLECKMDSIFIPKLMNDTNLLRKNDLKRLIPHLPERFKSSKKWHLSYSTMKHGISLRTFYFNMQGLSPSIIVVQDTNKHVFGVYSSNAFEIKKNFFGTGETFLFKILPHFEAFHSTGVNHYHQFADPDYIAFGGGMARARYGLYLDKELLLGTSESCDTFDNACLASEEHFKIVVMEVWTLNRRAPSNSINFKRTRQGNYVFN
eukprot:TRINITY_DN7586_c0_g1_i1.p1 TRINITY_DN7586_c0_g1~~TRINITY_DN7586_c0_g1_i1.p1  ORF type:complete len:490 (-),score=83.96 TRINITY_DN7586_c0_g1_i1:8-1369(-)